MRKSLKEQQKNKVIPSKGQELTLEQLQALGVVVKFVVQYPNELNYLNPSFMDVALVTSLNKFSMWNGYAWVVIASYNIEYINENIEEIIGGGNCAQLYIVEEENDLPSGVDNGNLGWVNKTTAYYIYRTTWEPLTTPTIDNYIDLPTHRKNGIIYYVKNLKAFYISRDSVNNPNISTWKAISTIETTSTDLETLPAVQGDICYTTDTLRYYIFVNGVWTPWWFNIEVVDLFPEIPLEPKIIWHTGDNQMWTASSLSTNWIPLMTFTNLTGEPGT